MLAQLHHLNLRSFRRNRVDRSNGCRAIHAVNRGFAFTSRIIVIDKRLSFRAFDLEA